MTDKFSTFARRMSSTQGFPFVVIAETPNPIRQLESEALRTRAEAMIGAVIDGLTLPPEQLQARMKPLVQQMLNPGVARSAVPV
ncbi:MAG TPA: hypothetical protein VNT02_07000 [Burkholderiales bacterium]|nr:hypothetical protein [Burkholderiales bacterium]